MFGYGEHFTGIHADCRVGSSPFRLGEVRYVPGSELPTGELSKLRTRRGLVLNNLIEDISTTLAFVVNLSTVVREIDWLSSHTK